MQSRRKVHVAAFSDVYDRRCGFTIIAMMVGCGIYGYIIATMASVVTSQDQMQKVRYTYGSKRLVGFVPHLQMTRRFAATGVYGAHGFPFVILRGQTIPERTAPQSPAVFQTVLQRKDFLRRENPHVSNGAETATRGHGLPH